jgi:tetratricopeptide (TPR) repeat protein
LGSDRTEALQSVLRPGAAITVTLSSGVAFEGKFLALERLNLIVNVGRAIRIINMTFVETVELHDATSVAEFLRDSNESNHSAEQARHRGALQALSERLMQEVEEVQPDLQVLLDPKAVSERAGSWDRTRALAARLWSSGGPEEVKLALELLRSIPASDATSQDCASIVRMLLHFGWNSSAARAAAAYYERSGTDLVYETDPVTRLMASTSVRLSRPDLTLRSLPTDPERLLERPEILLIFAAVNQFLGRNWEGVAPVAIAQAVEAQGPDLERTVKEFLTWQIKLRPKGFQPFQFESGRLVEGLHVGKVFTWKNEYGFIQPEGTTSRSERRIFHRKSVADPQLLGRIDRFEVVGSVVEFELRDPVQGSNHNDPVAHAVVVAASVDKGEIEESPELSRTESAQTDDADDGEPQVLPPEIVRLHDLGRYADVRDWVDRELAIRPESPFFAELRVKFDSYDRRSAQGGAPAGETSIDSGRRAVLIERDLERAEMLFRRALDEARRQQSGACAAMLRAARELVSLLSRRERQRRSDLIEILEEADSNGRTILSCAEGRLNDLALFYPTYAYNLIHVGELDRGFEAYEKALGLIAESREPKAAIEEARQRVERVMAGALVMRGRFDEALRILEDHRGDPKSMQILARALIGRGDLDEAKEVIEQLSQRRPDDAKIQQLRAELERGVGGTGTPRAAISARGGEGLWSELEQRSPDLGDSSEGEGDLAEATQQLVAQLGRIFASGTARVPGATDEMLLVDDRLRRVLRSGNLDSFPLGAPVGTLLQTADEDVEEEGSRLLASIELMVAVALGRQVTAGPSTRISLALESLIALDLVGPRDIAVPFNPLQGPNAESDAVAGDLMEVILHGVPPEAGPRPVGELVADIVRAALDASSPAHRRVLHLLARTTYGTNILRLASGGSGQAPAVPTGDFRISAPELGHLRASIEDVRRRTQMLRRAVSMLRLVEDEAVDVRLNQREQKAIADLLSAASDYVFTEADDRVLRDLKHAFRQIASATVAPSFAVDIDIARVVGDNVGLLARLRDQAKRNVTTLWVMALDRVAEHLRETCRRAELAVESPVVLEVDLVATELDAQVEVRGEEWTAKVALPLVIRNPSGGGRATMVEVDATLMRTASGDEQEYVDSSVRRARYTLTGLSPGSEAIIHLSGFSIPVSNPDASIVERVRLDLAVSCQRTLSNRETEMAPVEKSFNLELRLLDSKDYELRLQESQRACIRLNTPPDISGEMSRRIFGRDKEIAQLTSLFSVRSGVPGPTEGHVIYGLQQTGKTTLATIVREQLRRSSEATGSTIRTVYFTVSTDAGRFEDTEGNDHAFFRDFMSTVREELDLGDLLPDAQGPAGLIALLSAARSRSAGAVPLLVVDEFTRILAFINAGRMSAQARTVWRDVIARGDAHVLLIGHGSMQDFSTGLKDGDYPEFSSFGFTRLNFFSRETVDAMCTRPFEDSGLVFSVGAKEAVFEMSAGHTRIAMETVTAAAQKAIDGRRLLVNRGDVIRGVQDWDPGSAARMLGHLADPQVHHETRVDRARRRIIVEALAEGPPYGMTVQSLREACNEHSTLGEITEDEDVSQLLEQLENWAVVRRDSELGDDVIRLVPQFPRIAFGPQRHGSGESVNSAIEVAMRPAWPPW